MIKSVASVTDLSLDGTVETSTSIIISGNNCPGVALWHLSLQLHPYSGWRFSECCREMEGQRLNQMFMEWICHNLYLLPSVLSCWVQWRSTMKVNWKRDRCVHDNCKVLQERIREGFILVSIHDSRQSL